jgi:DNA-binding response OmpR family regulator
MIVDDDKEIAQLVSLYLQNEGFQTIVRHHGQDALDTLEQENVSLIVLDVMMPHIDGLEVCRKIRERHMLPILMLSAKVEDMDKVIGLMTGADDYMIKPFNPLELVARVKSLLRRSLQYNVKAAEQTGDVVKIQSVEINRTSHKVTVNGQPVQLTSREFDILYLLGSHPGRVFSAEEIFKTVWKEDYFNSNNTVMVHISNLRDKLEKVLGYKLIQTVWGVGYKIDD